jgi:hypothetical protein
MIEYHYVTWVVEGSNGQRLFGPCSFKEAQSFIAGHEDMIHSSYSASAPMPDHMVKGWENANLGYMLRRVTMKAVEV